MLTRRYGVRRNLTYRTRADFVFSEARSTDHSNFAAAVLQCFLNNNTAAAAKQKQKKYNNIYIFTIMMMAFII